MTSLRKFIRGSHVGIIELCNQSRRNALSRSTLSQLHEAIRYMENNDDVRVVVIQNTGSVFSSGHDLKEIQSLQDQNNLVKLKELFEICSCVMRSITDSNKPYVAKVNGVATAAGCQLVASCDLAYASTSSRFATPGVNIGLFCSTPSVALSRCIGKKKCMEMLLTGTMISAETAEEIGLINKCLSEEKLEDLVNEVVDLICTKSPTSIRIGKPVFKKQTEMTLEEAYLLTSDVMANAALEDECKNGIDAFLSKVKPSW